MLNECFRKLNDQMLKNNVFLLFYFIKFISNKKKMRILLFLSNLFLLLCYVQAAPTITAISTYIQYLNTAIYGSVLGGTRLYFTGSEFPRDTSQFSIYIGPYPCAMRDGFTTRFSCMTSPVNVSGTFDIKVYISNTLIECNIAIPCQFTYKWGIFL